MNRFIVLPSVLLLLGPTLAQAAVGPARPGVVLDEQSFAKTLIPFFKEHCVDCHGPDVKRASSRFTI
jgi:mono/diheme cytochrome c family protein